MKNPFITPESKHKKTSNKQESEAVKAFAQNLSDIKQMTQTAGWKLFEKYLLSMKENDELFFRQMPKESHYSIFVQGSYSRVRQLLDFINSNS